MLSVMLSTIIGMIVAAIAVYSKTASLPPINSMGSKHMMTSVAVRGQAGSHYRSKAPGYSHLEHAKEHLRNTV